MFIWTADIFQNIFKLENFPIILLGHSISYLLALLEIIIANDFVRYLKCNSEENQWMDISYFKPEMQ